MCDLHLRLVRGGGAKWNSELGLSLCGRNMGPKTFLDHVRFKLFKQIRLAFFGGGSFGLKRDLIRHNVLKLLKNKQKKSNFREPTCWRAKVTTSARVELDS